MHRRGSSSIPTVIRGCAASSGTPTPITSPQPEPERQHAQDMADPTVGADAGGKSSHNPPVGSLTKSPSTHPDARQMTYEMTTVDVGVLPPLGGGEANDRCASKLFHCVFHWFLRLIFTILTRFHRFSGTDISWDRAACRQTQALTLQWWWGG
jgi:hypothetical protein